MVHDVKVGAPAALALQAGRVGHDGARGRLVAEGDALDHLHARHELACARAHACVQAASAIAKLTQILQKSRPLHQYLSSCRTLSQAVGG